LTQQIRIVLYGNSLFLHGISLKLKTEPDLEVVHVTAETPTACLPGEISGACLLAFDIHEAPPERMLSLFKEIPNLTLLALDPEGDQLVELSSKVSGARTLADLIAIIRRHNSTEAPEQGLSHSGFKT
jgi:hypothetical protein